MSMNDSVLLTLAASNRKSVVEICENTGLSAKDLQSLIVTLNQAGAGIDESNGCLHWTPRFACLSASDIRVAMSPENGHIAVLDSTASTNAVLTAQDDIHRQVLLAEHQSAGVGRRGKVWLSPLGKNLYISCGWQMPSDRLFGALGLAVGVSIVNALREYGISAVGLKWPNDLYINSRKVGGILIDSSTIGKTAKLVVGLGVNVFKQHFPHSLDVPATTLEDALPDSSTSIVRNTLAGKLVQAVFKELDAIKRGNENSLTFWRDYDVSYNRAVTVLREERQYAGVAKGINAAGEFMLEVDGEIVAFTQAEVSLRM